MQNGEDRGLRTSEEPLFTKARLWRSKSLLGWHLPPTPTHSTMCQLNTPEHHTVHLLATYTPHSLSSPEYSPLLLVAP